MTERWVSTKKHYCDVCKCWISGHALNVANHAQSERHKANQQRMLQTMHANERQKKRDEEFLNAELRRIEYAGRQSFLQKDVFPNAKRSAVAEERSVLSKEASSNQLASVSAAPSNSSSRVGSISAAAQPAVSRSSGTPDIETTSEAAPVPPFNLQPVKSSWIASVDPFSNEPVYFNPVTGETSKTDPTASRSYNKAGFALPSQAASHDDQKLAAEKVIQQLLPTVNQMSEAYKAHLLALNSDPLSVVRIPESQNAAPSVSKPEIPRLGALPPQLAVLVQQPLASKASATPEVNRVRGVEKASILLTSQGADSDIQGPQSTPSLVDTISARCDVAAVPAETEQAHVNAEKPTAAGIPPRFVPSTTFNGSRPGYVFTTRSGLTGYFWDQEKLNCDTRQNKLQNPAEISPSAQSLNDHALVSLPSSEGLGAWTLVASEDSKFGDCVKEKKPTVSLPPTKIEFVTADPDIPKSTTDVLSALKEDADASKHLNADDLRRVEKKPFFPLSVASSETTAKVSPVKQEDDVLPTSSVSFKKRVVRPRGLKPMNRS